MPHSPRLVQHAPGSLYVLDGDHPVQIGGPGHVVQIDESVVSTPKRTRIWPARPGRQKWIFGGLDQETKEAFLVEVAQRDATTLLPLI